jgi:uncharacterized protein YndB with AHSA1/START domain
MPELVESIDVEAPPGRVWAALTDWARQGEWILATDVRPVIGPAQGVGGRLVAVTGLPLPGGKRLGVVDTFEITRWEPPTRVDVLHTGRVVRGPGTFEVQPRGEHSTVVCTEVWYLPYGYLGVAGWFLARPLVVRGLRTSLRRLAALAARGG